VNDALAKRSAERVAVPECAVDSCCPVIERAALDYCGLAAAVAEHAVAAEHVQVWIPSAYYLAAGVVLACRPAARAVQEPEQRFLGSKTESLGP